MTDTTRPGPPTSRQLTDFWDALNGAVTAPQVRSVDTPDGVRHYDDTGREYRAVEVDGELTYQPIEDAP